MSEGNISAVESAKESMLQTLKEAAAASTSSDDEERRRRLLSLGADLNDQLKVIGPANAPAAKREIQALVGNLDEVERRGLSALVKTTGGVSNEYHSFLASELRHPRTQRHASASADLTGPLPSSIKLAMDKTEQVARQLKEEQAAAVAPSVSVPKNAAEYRDDQTEKLFGDQGIIAKLDNYKQSVAQAGQDVKAAEASLRELRKERAKVSGAERAALDQNIKDREKALVQAKKLLAQDIKMAAMVDKQANELKSALTASSRAVGPRGKNTEAADAAFSGAPLPDAVRAAELKKQQEFFTPERLQQTAGLVGQPIADAIAAAVRGGKMTPDILRRLDEQAQHPNAPLPGAGMQALAGPGEIPPVQPTGPFRGMRGLGVNDQWLQYLPPNAQQAGQAFYKAKQDYYDKSAQTQNQILALLHSGMPIEYVIFLILGLLAQQNEAKLNMKLNEVQFASSLAQAKSFSADRQQLVNRIESQGGLNDAEKTALESGSLDSVKGLEQKLRDQFHLNDQDVLLAKDPHFNDNFKQAFQHFDSEVGSSPEIKAQELNIALSSYKEMSEAISGIISTIQKMLDGIIAKI